MTLRPYQSSSVALTVEALTERLAVLFYLATGGGKTVCAAEVIRLMMFMRRGGRIAFIAHREELINQAYGKLREWGIDPGVVWAGDIARLDYRKQVQVCSIQTLVRRLDLNFEFDGLVFDECHHLPASSYKLTRSAFLNAWVMGLTATPDGRADGQRLGGMFDVMIKAASIHDLIAQGWLVQPSYTVLDPIPGAECHDDDEAGERASAPRVLGNVTETWMQHGRGMPTVVFAYTVSHAEELAARFRLAGAKFETIHGEMGTTERQDVLDRLTRRELDGVTNCNVLTEGWDFPACQCVVLARRFGAIGAYVQAGGRGLRSFPGKSFARIIDHGGNYIRHGRLEADREIQLHNDARKEKAVREATERGEFGRARQIIESAARVIQIGSNDSTDMFAEVSAGPEVIKIAKPSRRLAFRVLRG